MKPLLLLLDKIKNISPYLFLILLYFIFINIEAQKGQKDSKTIENNIDMDSINVRVKIPVVPFTE